MSQGIQRSISSTIPRPISLKEPLSNGNENKVNCRKSLKSFGKKKTVSFSTTSIIDVEKWKKYNMDVSQGGCSSWDIKKNEELYEEQRKKEKEKDGCVCLIF